MAGNMGLIAGNVFQMQLVLSTDSTFKTSFRSSARNKNQIPLVYMIRKMKLLKSQENKKKFEPYVLTNGDTLTNY
jgi:hypothetical protein